MTMLQKLNVYTINTNKNFEIYHNTHLHNKLSLKNKQRNKTTLVLIIQGCSILWS